MSVSGWRWRDGDKEMGGGGECHRGKTSRFGQGRCRKISDREERKKRARETEIDRQIDRQRDRQAERETDRQMQRQREVTRHVI